MVVFNEAYKVHMGRELGTGHGVVEQGGRKGRGGKGGQREEATWIPS